MKKNPYKLRPVAIACMALAPQFASAPTAASGDSTLPEVEVKDGVVGPDSDPPTSSIGGGSETPLRDIPQSVTVS